MSCHCDACGKKVRAHEMERNYGSGPELCFTCEGELQAVIKRIKGEVSEDLSSRIDWATESFVAEKVRHRVGP